MDAAVKTKSAYWKRQREQGYNSEKKNLQRTGNLEAAEYSDDADEEYIVDATRSTDIPVVEVNTTH